MSYSIDSIVEHPDYGSGKIINLLGDVVTVDFFGVRIDVDINTLALKNNYDPQVIDRTKATQQVDEQKIQFRRAFEAINLGIVPPDTSQLIELTIGVEELKPQVQKWLEASENGLCKVFFGYYGSGKSHMLHFIKCMALDAGWVVSYLEFDPKAADPAKPHLVYRNLISLLEFPHREDGTRAKNFLDLIKEVRERWHDKNIRGNLFFKRSQWFSRAFEILLRYPHDTDNQEYLDACSLLGGNHRALPVINKMGAAKGYPLKVPRMPVTKEAADIYVFHLVVINELCKTLGYKGLAIIFDEAEHVRGYNVRRKERANNFFDLLARCAHKPILNDSPPIMNDHAYEIPQYWLEGPHFALFVGLTEADTFSNPMLSLRDACVFLHNEKDRIFLKYPTVEDFRNWCIKFLDKMCHNYPKPMSLIASINAKEAIASRLCESLNYAMRDGIAIRYITKLTSFIPCVLFSNRLSSLDELLTIISKTSSDYLGNGLPWEY